MKYSGVDLRVFKEYPQPINRRKRMLVPLKSVIGPKFRDRTDEICKLLEGSDPATVDQAFKEKGFYELRGEKIFPNYVEIEEVEIAETGRRFLPHVVEPSFGAERLTYLALEYAYDAVGDRAVLKLPYDIVPLEVVVLPLMAKDGLPSRAKGIRDLLVASGFSCEYDEAGSIGRRYARADEVGVPIAVTVDYQTIEDGTVTLRDRDTWKQVRSPADRLPELLGLYLRRELALHDLGVPFEPKALE